MTNLTKQQKREKTELVLANIYNLPPIPNIMKEVLTLLDNNNTTTAELAKFISKDQSLLTKIMTVANSPLYGLQRKVTSIDFAILVLGYTEIGNIIRVLSLVELFKNKTDQYLDQRVFWLHSFLTGSAAKRLADDLGYSNSGEAFISGFLHDIGVSVIHRYFHTDFIEIMNRVQNKIVSHNQAESDILGMTHQQIGNFLLERWNFPLPICNAVLYHENPPECKQYLTLTSIIHLAEIMIKRLEIGTFNWDNNLEVDAEALEHLRLHDDEKLSSFIEGYRELFIHQAEAVRYLS